MARATHAAGASPHRTGPLVIAHRGAWGPAPQNSPAAVTAAIELGADGIEIDVRRTADGRLVVVHDPRLGWRPVRRLTHDAVRERMTPGQAPLLADLLALAAGRVLVDIELKERGYVAEAMDAIEDALGPHPYVITSFWPAILADVRRARPAARTGLLVGPRRPRRLEAIWDAAGADVIAPHHGLARTGLLDWAAAHEVAAWVWTANAGGLITTLAADPRVEAIITDAPARALAITQGAFTSR